MEKNNKETPTGNQKANVFVGKDVIELVGNAMYLDPLTIYREYIQNSVDSIDEAIKANLLSSPSDAHIDITVDVLTRRINIRDNGIGIPNSQFLNRMLSIGGSTKRHTSARGFRGVGRLAGLGFCQQLVFRSRAVGGKVSQLTWDVRRMKAALAEVEDDGDIAGLIKEVTSTEILDCSDFPDHFFEVELVSPMRLGQDPLINFEKIRNYVGQNAPAEFSPEFSFADEIREFLGNSFDFREYPIFLNDDKGQIFKPYTNSIEFSDTKISHLNAVKFYELSSLDGDKGAVCWLAHHDYLGAITKNQQVGGLRARVGNIQVGERSVFVDAFPQDRFNSWAVGEVHVLDKRLVPNGRRDGFEHGTHLSNLTTQLLPIGHTIAQKCHKQSSLRNQSKRVDLALLHAETIADMLDQGALSKSAAKAKIMEAKGKVSEATKYFNAETYLGNGAKKISRRIKALEKRLEMNANHGSAYDPLSHLPKNKRSAYAEIIELIYACSNNQQVAISLVDQILKRL